MKRSDWDAMTSQLDFFSAPGLPVNTNATKLRAVSERSQSKDGCDHESMARDLEATGDYRILRRLPRRPVVEHARPGFSLKGVILDTETTGLDHRREEIIEIGAVAFTFNDAGEIGDVTGVYGGLQQPGVPIPISPA